MYREHREDEEIKENLLVRYPLRTRTLLAGVATCVAALLLATALDARLPQPKAAANAKPTDFIAENAMAHLINLTEIGPRVAGSYENEVLARTRVVDSLRQIAAAASIHNRVEWDASAADGGFALNFFDGLNSVYRGVRGVVARLRPAADSPRSAALLLNCHTDTVPDSPGASDDGAGCAVMLEAARALVAGPPLRRPVLLLLNSAEENIMQGSHAFVTSHPWAKSARTFINLEACGAGGREVLFQAGPRDPWLLEMYASLVPYPFASSVAQELFESGLIPADTDFRVFRDFGRLSGLDFAWSSNGWVYHTKLDDVSRVPPAALQRTGDNVLALMRGVQASDFPELSPLETGPPVYFDVGGVLLVILGSRAAAATAVLLLLLLAIRIWIDIKLAHSLLHVSGRRYRWLALAAGGAGGGGVAAAAGAAAALGAALHVLAPLSYYTHTYLLVPLYVIPAMLTNWYVSRKLFSWWGGAALGGGARRWAVVGRAGSLGAAGGPALGLLLGLAARLRSALVPALWIVPQLPLLALAVWELATNKLASQRVYATATLVGVTLPLLQASSLSLGVLQVMLPLLGRAGTAMTYPDVVVGVACAIVWSSLCAWLLPLVLLAKIPNKLWWCGVLAFISSVVVAMSVSPYSSSRPHRLMLFHTRRTIHHHHTNETTVDNYFWIPHLDVNTRTAAADYVSGLSTAESSESECDDLIYCGAPYYLPVLQLIRAGYKVPAAEPPAPTLAYNYTIEVIDQHTVRFNATLHGTAHMMLIVSPVEGAEMSQCDVIPASARRGLQAGAAWGRRGRRGRRRTYFLLLHVAAPRPAPAALSCLLRHELAAPPAYWLQLSAAAHALFGPLSKTARHRQLEASMPDWIAPTGWGVDLHLHTL